MNKRKVFLNHRIINHSTLCHGIFCKTLTSCWVFSISSWTSFAFSRVTKRDTSRLVSCWDPICDRCNFKWALGLDYKCQEAYLNYGATFRQSVANSKGNKLIHHSSLYTFLCYGADVCGWFINEGKKYKKLVDKINLHDTWTLLSRDSFLHTI